MNGASVSAPGPAPGPAAAPVSASGAITAAAAANDAAGTGQDFAALLDNAADAAPASDTDASAAKATAVKPDIRDDAKNDKGGVASTDGALPDWLQAMRQSLSLVGTMFATPAAAADAKATKPATALPARPTAATAATDTSKATTTATARTDPAAIAALTADAGGDPVLTAEPPAPTADLRFDAMLAAVGDHDAVTPPPAIASGLPGGAPTAMPTATSTVPAAAAPPPMTVPPDHPDFTHDLGERIVWITDSGLSSARIDLHPLDLGRLSVHVHMHGDEAQVSFAADNPATRALLQDSLPQLRELMSVQGLQLLRAQVEQKVGASRSSDSAFSQSRERGDGGAVVRRVTKLKLVDAYV